MSNQSLKAVIGLKILVRAHKEEMIEQQESGLLLVDNKAVRPKYGTVYMIGGKVNTELQADGELTLEAGDQIAYDRNEYPTIKVDGADYELIHKLNLVGVCG